MNREIKFRAWDNNIKFMYAGTTIEEMLSDPPNITGLIIMQYTALKDKNGKEIYEGDICNCREYECYGVIKWNDDDAGFYFYVAYGDGTFDEEDLYEYVDELEVIGNIFENNELLGVEQ